MDTISQSLSFKTLTCVHPREMMEIASYGFFWDGGPGGGKNMRSNSMQWHQLPIVKAEAKVVVLYDVLLLVQISPIRCRRRSFCGPSRGRLSKTEQDRPTVTM